MTFFYNSEIILNLLQNNFPDARVSHRIHEINNLYLPIYQMVVTILSRVSINYLYTCTRKKTLLEQQSSLLYMPKDGLRSPTYELLC